MATNKKITELTELGSGQVANDDVLALVDISTSTTKKIKVSTLRDSVAGVLSLTASSPLSVDLATGDVTISIPGPIAVNKGGTGAATFTDGGVLIGKGTAAFETTGVLADGTIIIGDGATNPTTLAAFSSSTGTLKVANGGTGAATLTANNVLLGNGTSAVQVVAPGTSGNLLTSNGTTWSSTAPVSSVTTFAGGTTGLTPAGATSGAISLAGTLAVANGGTGGTTSTGTGAVVLATNPALVGYTVNTAAGVDGEWTTAGLTVYKDGVTPQHDGPLHVMSGTAGTITASADADDLIIEAAASPGMTFLVADGGVSRIRMTNPADGNSGGLLLAWDDSVAMASFQTATASAKLGFYTGAQQFSGEWNTTGLTCFASGVTPQHDGVLHVMSGTAGTWTADSGSVIVAESAIAGGISIGTPDAITGTLSFSSPTKTAASGALVQFNYNSGVFGFRTFKVGAEMQFKTGNDTTALTLNSSQQTLHTVGSVSAPSISFSGYADTGIHMVTDGSGNNMVFGSSGGEIFRAGMYTPATPDLPRITIANGWTGDPGVGGSLTLDCKAVRATDTGNGIVFNVPTSTSGGASEDMVVLKAVCSNSTNGARQGDLVCYTRNTSMDYAWRAYYNGNFTVRGALAKGSGSFNIEHPHPDKKATHRLVHGFIEGPRNDLIYRGVISMVNGWATVDLDAVSGMTSGTWVLLCRDPTVFATASGWAKVRGTVVGATLTLESDDKTYSELANWIVIAERHDEHIMDVNTTDDEGHLIVEPLMTEEQLIARERTRAAAEARAAETEAEAATIH